MTDDIVPLAVEWEADERGQHTWTEIHDKNVEVVLNRSKAREGCSDLFVVFYKDEEW